MTRVHLRFDHPGPCLHHREGDAPVRRPAFHGAVGGDGPRRSEAARDRRNGPGELLVRISLAARRGRPSQSEQEPGAGRSHSVGQGAPAGDVDRQIARGAQCSAQAPLGRSRSRREARPQERTTFQLQIDAPRDPSAEGGDAVSDACPQPRLAARLHVEELAGRPRARRRWRGDRGSPPGPLRGCGASDRVLSRRTRTSRKWRQCTPCARGSYKRAHPSTVRTVMSQTASAGLWPEFKARLGRPDVVSERSRHADLLHHVS